MFAVVPKWWGRRLGAGQTASMLADNGYATPIIQPDAETARRYSIDVQQVLNAEAKRRLLPPDWAVRVSACPAELAS